MPEEITIHEAKTHFSKLVRRAEAGEEIVVRRGREPVARIVPLEKRRGGVTGRGALKDEIRIAPDFDQADAEIQRMFEESEIFPDESARAGES
jgi:prevent-host-death family protein